MSNLMLKPIGEIFDPSQVQVLKNLICKDLTDDELRLFGYVATRTGLDPFAKQIYAVKRDGKLTIQTSIDGLRLIAFRTGAYAGRNETLFDYDNDKLVRAKVTIYKLVQGIRCDYTATANWNEYYPGEKMGFMWRKLPETMLEKVAESKALRMAFPAELSGLYTETEMEQAEAPNDTKAQAIKEAIKIEETVVRSDSDLKEFAVTFGKYSGMTLKEIPLDELVGYVDYLESESIKRRRPLEGRGKELVQAIRGFLEEVSYMKFGGK